MAAPSLRLIAPRTPAQPTRPAPLEPLARTFVPTRVLEPRQAPRQLELFTRC
jgi:hypothetical protein